MFSPSMPTLVEPPFYPPPQGATNGGEPGHYDPFPGWGGVSSSQWNPPQGTPHPGLQHSFSLPGHQPTSAHSYTYGSYPPWGQPTSAGHLSSGWGQQNAAPTGWGQTQTTSWGAQTPGGTWGAPSPASHGGPHTPAAYSPWAPSQQYQQQQQGTWITPNMTQNPQLGPAPGTPYESSSGQPVNAGWFGAGGGGGGWNVGATGYPEGDWLSHPPAPSKKRSNSVKRSGSHKSPKRPALQRSASWGNVADYGRGYPSPGGQTYGHNIPPYAQGDLYDERNLARRPRDWRPDYTPRPGISAYIPMMSKNKSDVREYVDMTRRVLHPLLLYHPSAPAIYCNLLDTPFHPSSVEFRNLNRPHNEIDFAQLAVQPSSGFLRLIHSRLPWYVDVYQVHPNGITVLDVLAQMHAQLQTPIHGRHFWNEVLSDSDRAGITKAFQHRCRGDSDAIQRGVIQLDFLGQKVVFEGLVRSQKGLWEMKFSKED